MTNRITRRELLRRGAGAGALLSFPSVLAACGGAAAASRARRTTGAATARPPSTTLADRLTDLELAALHRHRREDEEAADARAVRAGDRRHRPSTSRTSTTTRSASAKIQAPLSRGQGDRPRHHRPHRLDGRRGWSGSATSEKLDKERHAEHVQPRGGAREPRAGTRTATTACPWQSGLTGIAYDPKKVGRRDHVDRAALHRPEAQGEGHDASLEMPDTLGLIMLETSASIPRRSTERVRRGDRQAPGGGGPGQIRQFTGNDYAALLANGDIGPAIAWSGDVVQLQLDNPNLQFVDPGHGGMIWTDNMLIPTGGDVFTASTFMNFVYDPKVAAQIEAYVNYISPGGGRKEEMHEDRPGDRGERADLPERGDARPGEDLRRRGRSTTRTTRRSGRRDRRPRTPRHEVPPSAPLASRRTSCSRRGSRSSRCSSSSRCTTSGTRRCRTATVSGRLHVHVGLGELHGRVHTLPGAASSARSSTPGSRRSSRFSSPTRSRTGSRSAAAGGRTSCSSSSSRRSSSRT